MPVLLINLHQISVAKLSLFLAQKAPLQTLSVSPTGSQQSITKSISEVSIVPVWMVDTSLIMCSHLMSSTPIAKSVGLMLHILLKVFSMLNRLTLSLSSWSNGPTFSPANREKYLFYNLGLFDLFWIQ